MKRLVISCALALSFVAIGEETATKPPFPVEKPPFNVKEKPKTEEERAIRKAWFQKQQMIHTGGQIVKPGSQQGEIVYLNCQKKADIAWLRFSADYFREKTKFNITVKDGGTFDIKNPKVDGNATLFVIDDPALPPVLVAPENAWAMVNVAGLTKGNGEKPQFFEARVKKELTRGFAFLCGASNSQYPCCLVGGLKDAEELDTFADQRLQVDVMARFPTYMKTYGVTPAFVTIYRKAVEQGWAPQPTNEYQKAIWDKVHALPTKPIKIEP